ncbi:MAG TPA: geranylgeranylglycerol-phosphate geranylgeranyltransferase [Edaphocola sp.]|nr:geranylgeranylglycerol-phosphate geranylgeranyltransferase [Edaphocola sp.]
MRTIKSWCKLIRLGNLVIIFLSQIIVWACLLKPFETILNITLFLNLKNAISIAIGTTLIAAAGYIINDYYDVAIDAVNRPGKAFIGKQLSKKLAFILYVLLNVIALVIFGVFAFYLGKLILLIVPVFCVLLLWLYSYRFKRQFVIGNIVVASLTALALLILVSFEPSVWAWISSSEIKDSKGFGRINPLWILAVYAIFAFLLNWIREIIKDMEDLKGDAEGGCKTMPIKIGIPATISFVKGLVLVTVLLLITSSIGLFFLKEYLLTCIVVLMLVIPLLLVFKGIGESYQVECFSKYSKFIKLIMLLGIITLIIFYFSQYH